VNNKLIKFAKYSLGTSGNPSLDTLKSICKDETPEEEIDPLNLVGEVPKILTFYLSYGEYFNGDDSSFSNRKTIIHMLPQSFVLNELFVPSFDGSDMSLTSKTTETEGE